jgi:hypothetical protein
VVAAFRSTRRSPRAWDSTRGSPRRRVPDWEISDADDRDDLAALTRPACVNPPSVRASTGPWPVGGLCGQAPDRCRGERFPSALTPSRTAQKPSDFLAGAAGEGAVAGCTGAVWPSVVTLTGSGGHGARHHPHSHHNHVLHRRLQAGNRSPRPLHGWIRPPSQQAQTPDHVGGANGRRPG